MSEPYSFPQISEEDIGINADNKNLWFKKVLPNLNYLFIYLSDFTNKNVTYENLRENRIEIEFSTTSTYSGGDFETISFPYDLGGERAFGVDMVQLVEADDAIVSITTSPSLSHWFDDGENVNITYISGLANSTTYRVRFRVF